MKKKTDAEIREELTTKYQSLLDRIELIKQRPLILSHTVDILNQLMEFILKKRSSDTFTIEVYEQQTKNLDQIEGSVDEIAEQMEGLLDK